MPKFSVKVRVKQDNSTYYNNSEPVHHRRDAVRSW